MDKKIKFILIFIILTILCILFFLFFRHQNTKPDSSISTNISTNINEITNNNQTIDINNQLDISKIKLEIDFNTLTPSGAKIIITDTNTSPATYGEWFEIEKENNSKWEELTPINKDYSFTSLGWLIGENKSLEHYVDWSDLYGILSSGHYRIVKKIDENNKIYAEFNIE